MAPFSKPPHADHRERRAHTIAAHKKTRRLARLTNRNVA
jgi:hypothetical protein